MSSWYRNTLCPHDYFSKKGLFERCALQKRSPELIRDNLRHVVQPQSTIQPTEHSQLIDAYVKHDFVPFICKAMSIFFSLCRRALFVARLHLKPFGSNEQLISFWVGPQSVSKVLSTAKIGMLSLRFQMLNYCTAKMLFIGLA